jgi:biotin carboxyl carrier protein
MKYFAEIDGQTFQIDLGDDGRISVNGKKVPFDAQQGSKPEHFSLLMDGHSHQVWIENAQVNHGGGSRKLRVHLEGYDFDVAVDDERSKKLREFNSADAGGQSEGHVIAPMPGLVVKLLVQPGQMVKKGDGVIIVEAMKMENEIRAPFAGEIKEIAAAERQAVDKGDILVIVG